MFGFISSLAISYLMIVGAIVASGLKRAFDAAVNRDPRIAIKRLPGLAERCQRTAGPDVAGTAINWAGSGASRPCCRQ